MWLALHCGLSAEPEFRSVYAGADFTRKIIGWKIDGDASAALQALVNAFPPAPKDDLRIIGLRLMAKTKRRAASVEMDTLLLSEFERILGEYPAEFAAAVVRDWDRRDGDEGIFTPSAAELRRALDDRAADFLSLKNALIQHCAARQ